MQAHVDDSRVSWKIYIFLTSLCFESPDICKGHISLELQSCLFHHNRHNPFYTDSSAWRRLTIDVR